MARVTLGGSALVGMDISEPAASVRLLIPSQPGGQLILPEWNGNEFLLPDGSRPIIRTFTPSLRGPDERDLDLDIVLHGSGAVAGWAAAARPGYEAAVSGPGRGYAFDPGTSTYVIFGDETAVPAIGQLLAAAPEGVQVTAHIEVSGSAAVQDMIGHDGTAIYWHERDPESAPGSKLIQALAGADLVEGTRVWAAGEAAAMQQIRRHLFEERSIPRAEASVRGYWKVARPSRA